VERTDITPGVNAIKLFAAVIYLMS
jgi:hypothetical protein